MSKVLLSNMSFTIGLRQGPARLAQRLPAAKQALRAPILRSFHKQAAAPAKQPSPIFSSRTRVSGSTATRSAFARTTGQQQSRGQHGGAAQQTLGSDKTRRLLTGGAIVGGTLVAINAIFNSEKREDGGMPLFEREYLNDTFMHVGLGIGIIGLAARQMVQSGFVYRIMVTNPWVVGLGGLALSFGSFYATRSISPDNYIAKYAAWGVFNATQAALMAPMMLYIPGPILARAGMYTIAMMGAISLVGATAKQEKYLYIGGPLLAGAAIVAVSGLAPLVIPATAVRTLALTEKLWLYGGLAVFGGFTLYDVQKVLHHARLAQAGYMRKDAVVESMHLELDFINLFVRFAQILMMQQNRKK